jgi:iron complex transport system substrate-binding protein
MKSHSFFVSLALMAAFSAHAVPVTVTHGLGSTSVEQNPQRVVVLGMGPLDAASSFGIEPVATTKVPRFPVGLEKFSDDKYGNAGSLFEPNYENIYLAKPDLIIIGPRNSKNYPELSKIAPTILFAADASKDYWQSTQEQWRNLGKVFSVESVVEKKIALLDLQFKAIRLYNDTHQLNALTLLSSGGNISAFGATSRFASIYIDFGFKETVKGLKVGRHGDAISYEFISEHNPQVLFVLDRDKLVNKDKSHTREDFENELVKSTDAYKQHRVKFLDIDAWYVAVSGVHATEMMIKDMQDVQASVSK